MMQLDTARARLAWLSTAAAIGAALQSRAARFVDGDVRKAVSAAMPGFIGVDLSDPDRGHILAGAIAQVMDALRVSADPEAAQLLVDCAADISAADIAAAPQRPPVADQAIVLPTPSPPGPAPRALSRQLARQTAAAVRDALRAMACVAYARRVMATTYATRDDALHARAGLTALFAPLLDTGALDQVSYGLVAKAWGDASGHLLDQAAGLKRIIRVESSRPLPATLLAWQIYGDTTRAGELVARNRVATPAFMPTIIEAISP
ncbi:hypothetical protein ACERNI_10800 [Camelimonas sp. ID_303_24]